MKKFFTLSLMCCVTVVIQAQNIQLHYDFGHLNSSNENTSGRPALTTTIEMFRPDKWGSTYFFVDMDYKDNSVAGAYWEIARELKFWKGPLSAHIEYNGGRNSRLGFPNAYLAGVTYTWNAKDFSRGFSVMTLYKYLAKQRLHHSWQLTGTWYLNMCNNLFTFSGFADFWGDRRYTTGHNICYFVTEPQFWVNLNKIKGVDKDLNLSIGTEWEISNNFIAQDYTWYWIPTLAAKWSF